MSSDDDDLYGRPGLNAEAGYEPMAADPRVPQEPDDNTTYDDVDHAFDEVQKLRGKVEREPLIERAYVSVGTDDEGTPRPRTETVTAERAADDLARIRSEEVQAIEDSENASLRAAVDSAKGIATEAEIAAWQQSQQEQLAAQQQQQQEAQAQPPPGVDKELYQLLRDNPRISQALNAELSQVEAARKAYATSAHQAAQIACASLVASEPLLQGINPDQVHTALTSLSGRTQPAHKMCVRIWSECSSFTTSRNRQKPKRLRLKTKSPMRNGRPGRTRKPPSGTASPHSHKIPRGSNQLCPMRCRFSPNTDLAGSNCSI